MAQRIVCKPVPKSSTNFEPHISCKRGSEEVIRITETSIRNLFTGNLQIRTHVPSDVVFAKKGMITFGCEFEKNGVLKCETLKAGGKVDKRCRVKGVRT